MIQRFSQKLSFFSNSEDGGGTIWGLIWFMLFVGVGGLGVDISNAHRVRSMMQVTSDVIAHEAVLKLPDRSAALAAGLAAAEKHMPARHNGIVLTENNLEFGEWDDATRSFTKLPETIDATAVRVVLNRNEANKNSVGTQMLRIAGLWFWEIKTIAAATYYEDRCYFDGMISAKKVRMRSNNVFGPQYCIFGVTGLDLYNNNDFTLKAWAGRGSDASGNCDGIDLLGKQGDQCNFDSNPDLESRNFTDDTIHPDRLNTLASRIDAAVTNAPAANTFEQAQWRNSSDPMIKNIDGNDVLSKLQTPRTEQEIFYLKCDSDNDELTIPNGAYEKLTLVTNCKMQTQGGGATQGATFAGVTLISTSTKAFKVTGGSESISPNIIIRGNSRLGVGCGPGEGAEVLSLGSVQVEGDVRHWGAKITAGGKVFVAGSNTAYSTFEHSLTIHAGDDIILESEGSYGLCDANGDYHVVRVVPILVY